MGGTGFATSATPDLWRSALAASPLSSLAGLLAGISFAAIVLVLQISGRDDAKKLGAMRDAVRVLVVAFAGMTIAALLYAIEYGWSSFVDPLSQRAVDAPTPRYVHTAAASVLATGRISLFVAVGLLLHAHDLPGVARTTRKVTLLLSFLAVLEVDQGFQDTLNQLTPVLIPLASWTWTALVLGLAIALFAVASKVGNAVGRRPSLPASRLFHTLRFSRTRTSAADPWEGALLYPVFVLTAVLLIAAILITSFSAKMDPAGTGWGSLGYLAGRTVPWWLTALQVINDLLVIMILALLQLVERAHASRLDAISQDASTLDGESPAVYAARYL